MWRTLRPGEGRTFWGIAGDMFFFGIGASFTSQTKIVGMQGVANMAEFLNWVLEYAPASDRPLYIGFANTLNGITLVMPLVGGWILAASGSYVLLFAFAAAGPVGGLVLLRALSEPRGKAAAAQQESTRLA